MNGNGKIWTRQTEQVFTNMDVDPEQGLDRQAVKERRRQHGPNRLQAHEPKSVWAILIDQFKSIIVGLLVISAVVSFVFSEVVEGAAIVAVVLINAAIGFFTELRAVRSMEALRELSSVDAKVIRSGSTKQIPAEKIVPGDILVVDGGDVVTADIRLFEASKLQANESALTGESNPVSKQTGPLEEDLPLAERSNMLFKGTAVTRGAGKGVVVATGMDTELGQISSLVKEAEEEHTPLEKRLDKLGQTLVWVTLGIITIVALVGILRGKDALLMIETAVALAVAAVPEGLPIVATIALARGMTRLAHSNALINRLSSVETLGSSSVVCTDKTGTLTENQMTVSKILIEEGEIEVSGEGLETEGQFTKNESQWPPEDHAALQSLLETGLLCNNATLEKEENEMEAVGEPMEVALLVAGRKAGLRRDDLLEDFPEAREIAFDPEVKMMATFHEENGAYRVAVKGAPEEVLSRCTKTRRADGTGQMRDDDRGGWLDTNTELARSGFRVVAIAEKESEAAEDPYSGLTFLGLVALQDPPREDVSEALDDCKRAGVRVVMVTGDQPLTATSVAQSVGLTEGDTEAALGTELTELDTLDEEGRRRLLETKIFARVSPKQKLDLIALHQAAGEVVAMTGDGVNDAPALKKADIGVAMGKRGTQVAREAADMVLEDDAFATIVLAIRIGRVIFNNIRRFVLYLLSCNISEIMVVFFASLLDWTLPVRPLQILFLNLVTDVFPALALGVSEGDPAVMEHNPRPKDEPVLTRRHWVVMSIYSLVITVAVFGAFLVARGMPEFDTPEVVTISFLTLALAQLWHVFNMRDRGSNFLRNDVVRSKMIWGALALCVGLLLIAVYIPFLSDLLTLRDPGLTGWGLAIGFSLLPWISGQIWKEFQR